MSALAATVAHTAEPISPRARHYADQFRTLLALKLVDALKALEAAKAVQDDAYEYGTPDEQQAADHAFTTAFIEAQRIMDQLGLDARIVGSALS